jgi:hypothetical protein
LKQPVTHCRCGLQNAGKLQREYQDDDHEHVLHAPASSATSKSTSCMVVRTPAMGENAARRS